jgi:hypothetical protein
METSATLREDSHSTISKIVVAIALAFTICGVAAGPALADHDHDGDDHHRGNGWRHHGGHHQRHWRDDDAYYAPAPNHYYAPRGYYYAPPPVVYYPRPRSGLDLFFGLR